jgi:hypothetical protein
MPGQTSGGGLPPLPYDLTPEARALTHFLREHFGQLRISPREYGRIHNWDAEAVTEFLCGDPIPPQEFIDALLDDAGPGRSTGEVDSDHTQSTRLREAALQTADARKAEQERLERELSRVQNVIRLAEARERDLSSQLAEREAEYDSLLRSYEQLKAAQRAAATGPKQLESYQPRLNEIDRDRGETQKEIRRLNVELGREQARRAAAEEKRDELRAELDRARVLVHLAGGSVPDFGHYTPPAFTILHGKTVWPFLATGSLVAFYCAFYLGLVYHLLSSQQIALKLLTISWLTLPVCLLVIMVRVGHGEFKHSFRYLVSAALLVAALFFIGALI